MRSGAECAGIFFPFFLKLGISWFSFVMDNSKVRCLKCNTRGVPAHGAVSEGGSRRYSPVLLRLIGCRCRVPCFFFSAQKLDAFGGLYEASPCVRLQEPKKKNTLS